jgi:Na+-driven multidrug efflux pump
MLIQTNINVFGPDAMAGNAAFGKIDGFLYMPLNAFGLAATTFVGQNIGARKLDRVKRGAITAVLLGFAVSAAGAVVVFLVSEPLLQIFTKQNAEAVRYGLIAMHYLAPFYCIFSATEVLSGVVRGAGSPLQSTIITAVCICALRVTLVSILQPIFNDIRVVFIAYPISWSVSSITFLLYYRFGKWIKM